MGLILSAILVVYVLLVRGIFRREFYGVRNTNPTQRAFRRSLVCAVFFGFGGLGTEGFGLPVPSLIAISVCLALSAKELLVANLIAFAVSWGLLLVFFFVREHYIESEPSRGLNRHYGRFSLRQDRSYKSRRLLIGLAAVVLTGTVFGIGYLVWQEARLPVDEPTYAEREFLPRSLAHAREIQRITNEFFATERRLPCPHDDFIDIDALLRDAHHNWKIDVVGCGRFSISLLGGRFDGTIFFTATPELGEDAAVLVWSCVSARYERIEQLTGGECIYQSPYVRSR